MNIDRNKLFFVSLAVMVHLYLGRCIVFSRWAMERQWCNMLGGDWKQPAGIRRFVTVTSELPQLPVGTEAALRFGLLIPVFGLLATLLVAFLFRRPEDRQRFFVALLSVTLLSLMLTACYCFGIAKPGLYC